MKSYYFTSETCQHTENWCLVRWCSCCFKCDSIDSSLLTRLLSAEHVSFPFQCLSLISVRLFHGKTIKPLSSPFKTCHMWQLIFSSDNASATPWIEITFLCQFLFENVYFTNGCVPIQLAHVAALTMHLIPLSGAPELSTGKSVGCCGLWQIVQQMTAEWWWGASTASHFIHIWMCAYHYVARQIPNTVTS